MESYRINSTVIKTIQYDEENKILELEFWSGGVYQYKDLPKYMLEWLINAPSVWKFFEDNIRNYYYYKKTADLRTEEKHNENWRHPWNAQGWGSIYKHFGIEESSK